MPETAQRTHSPAPFRVQRNRAGSLAVIDANYHRIANLAFARNAISSKVTDEEREANARLFAAAPKLLALLARCRDELSDLNQSEEDAGAFLDEIDAALAEAEPVKQ